MTGEDLDAVVERRQLLQRMEQVLSALPGSDGEVRACRVADEQRVSRQRDSLVDEE